MAHDADWGPAGDRDGTSGGNLALGGGKHVLLLQLKIRAHPGALRAVCSSLPPPPISSLHRFVSPYLISCNVGGRNVGRLSKTDFPHPCLSLSPLFNLALVPPPVRCRAAAAAAAVRFKKTSC